MQAVGHQRTRRRKKSLRVAPLARSQSLDVVATASPSSVARRKAMSRDGYNYGDTLENSRGPHLPPLGGRKGRLIRLESPLQQFLPGMEASLRETSTAARSRGTPPTAGKTSSSSSSFSSSSSSSSPASSSVQADPYRPGAESSPASSAVQPDPCRPVTEWVDAADIFVQPGQSAGIAFQWMETPTAAGLSVLAVTEGSLAAKHGGVAPGMLLVEVSRKRVDGMGQDEVMRVVQAAASLPRVLTLARILAAPSQAAVGARRNLRRETQPEDAPAHKALDSFVAFNRFPAATSSSHRPPSSDDGLRALRSNSSPPLSDGGAYRASDSVGATPARATHSTANMVSSGPRRLTSPEHTLALRFVGSRGDIALFDRDHVLGLKNRDIEFVPTGSRTKAQRVNSKKSLGELTRDWRNDPCSTPARRRRLINDACKAIVRSYTWASVERVAELRREEVFASRIQGAARMWAAQKVRRLKLAECRQKAALTLQCGWLSCAARRRVATLMEDRDHARRVDRRKRLNREAQERRHREEVRMGAEQREIEREERRRRLEVVVVSVQRKVREAQEHRRLTQAERLRERQCESKMIRATTSVQAAFRWRRQVRERRSRMGLLEKMKQKGKRDAAASRVQRAWRRHRAAIFDHQRRETKETPPSLPSLSAVNPGGSGTEKPSVPATKVNVAQEYTPSPPRNHPKILGGWSEGQQPDRDNSSRQGWSALDLPRAAANACEGVGAAADSAAITDCGRRSNTSDKVAEESAPSRQNTTRHLPPSGMMTVRVRRGSEETSLVTPIVLTESGIAASEAAADDDGDVHLGLDNAQKNGAHQPWTEHVGSPNAASKCSTYSTERFHASGDAEVANARSPSSMLTKEAHGGNNPAELATPASSTAEVGKHQAGDARSKALVFLSTATRKSKENAARPWSALAATTNATPIAGGEGETVAAAASGTALDNTKPAAEQFFMEDSQVYLGCATCGVKYLVEAVDPRLPESTHDQPVPEVLYLCTTCGETLKSDEDGRWRRRRRPSSAPAAPGRRDTLFDHPPNWLAESREGWSRATATAGGGTEAGAGLVEASKDAATPRRVSGWDEGTTAKLKYAPCARIIQHAYRDFRHRQYLRDWASALLGRWLLDRTRARHQWRRRLAFRRAVVRVQSAARAASARVRFSALRAARLRLWMDKVAGLLNSNLNDDNDDLSPSPVAARILHELDLASLPPPPPPPPTPVPPPTSQPIPPTSSPPPAPAPSSPFNEAASSSSRSSTNSPSRSGGYRVGARETKDEGCALAHALAPRMGAPPPGCPTAYQVDWGQSAVKLTLAFPPRVRNHAVVECVADSSSGYR